MKIRKAILMTVLLVAVAFCGGCVERMTLNLANGMVDWGFQSKTADSYRIGSWTGTGGRAFDALYWDTVREGQSIDELARELERRLAELERAAAAVEDDDNGNGD